MRSVKAGIRKEKKVAPFLDTLWILRNSLSWSILYLYQIYSQFAWKVARRTRCTMYSNYILTQTGSQWEIQWIVSNKYPELKYIHGVVEGYEQRTSSSPLDLAFYPPLICVDGLCANRLWEDKTNWQKEESDLRGEHGKKKAPDREQQEM